MTHKDDSLRNRYDSANDIRDLTDERVDALSALLTVSAEQLDDRLAAQRLLDKRAHRTQQLIEAVFGSSTPSIENYLASRAEPLQAA